MENFILNHFSLFIAMLIALMIWSLIWKGLALWKSARLGHKKWFIAMLIINTAGILEILYLFVFSKRQDRCKCGCFCGKKFGESHGKNNHDKA